MRNLSIFLIVTLLFIQNYAPTVSAQTSNKYQAQLIEFEEFVKTQMATDKIPGLSVGFIKDDFVWTKGFGFADLENKTPAKADSMYRMASVNKPMTAAAILQLAEKGKINLDAEVQTYVPYFPKKQFPVTVRQLLGHLGGISHYKDYEKEGRFKDYKNTRQAIAVFENFDLIAEPGTRYNYTSYGYNLLGAVIEGATGKSYGEYMSENIWRPLGMTETRLDNPNDLIPNRVRGYQLVGNQVKNSEFVDISSRFAAGGIRSNVLEMLKFGRGIHRGEILSKASLELIYNSMTTKSGMFTGYGAGWGISNSNGQFMISHSGGQQETSTYLFSFPTRNLTIAIAANLEGANNGVIVAKLFELLTGESWNINAYIADREKLPFYQVSQGMFDEGAGYYDRQKKPFTDNPKDLNEAFAYVNQYANADSLKTNLQTARTKLSEARHPVGGQKFAKIGSFMAQKLKESGKNLKDYSSTGALSFIADYIALYKKDASIPQEYRFNESFERVALDLNNSWGKTNSPELRKLTFNAQTNFEAVGTKLKKDFSSAQIYPNYANQINSIARNLFLSGNENEAVKAGQLGVDLYPNLENVNTTQGVLLIFSGNKEKGKEFLKKANEINPRGEASAGGLNSLAYQLSGTGLTDAGLEVLKVAVELYPNEANLFDSLGDFYTKKGIKDKAIESYQKALAINPSYPNAENAKAAIKKLETK